MAVGGMSLSLSTLRIAVMMAASILRMKGEKDHEGSSPSDDIPTV